MIVTIDYFTNWVEAKATIMLPWSTGDKGKAP